MNSSEKFLLFVATYASALQIPQPRTTIQNARHVAATMPNAIPVGEEERVAFEFVSWALSGIKPAWMPKTIEEAESLTGIVPGPSA